MNTCQMSGSSRGMRAGVSEGEHVVSMTMVKSLVVEVNLPSSAGSSVGKERQKCV